MVRGRVHAVCLLFIVGDVNREPLMSHKTYLPQLKAHEAMKSKANQPQELLTNHYSLLTSRFARSGTNLGSICLGNPEIIIPFTHLDADLLIGKQFKDREEIEDQTDTRGESLQQLHK